MPAWSVQDLGNTLLNSRPNATVEAEVQSGNGTLLRKPGVSSYGQKRVPCLDNSYLRSS